jgi:hypothetical protein
MGTRRDARKQRKREKHRKVRAERQARRKARHDGARGGWSAAARWPVGECFLEPSWHEQGARTRAAFVRSHPSGRSAVALFEVDLTEVGIVDGRTHLVDRVEQAQALVADFGGEDAMLVTSPEQVVAVLLAAEAHGRTHGHTPPRAFQDAASLWADIDPEAAPHEVLVGRPPEPASGGGFWSRLFGGRSGG